MPADRAGYAAKQAALLDALLRGGALPQGFAAAKADAASRSLRRKRVSAIRHVWPALTVALGDRLHERFDAFALTTGPPAFGEGLTDGLAFATWLVTQDEDLGDDVRVEAIFARAIIVRTDGDWRPRRGPFLRAARLRHPRRLLLVVYVPGVGRRHCAVRIG